MFAFLLSGCISYSSNTVRRSDAELPRDAVTGILQGAEERWLGPADARTAVLFVSGFIGAGQNFGHLPDRLGEAGFCVRVIRLPGLGTSPLDFERVESAELIEKVRSEVVVLKRDHERVFIVTHSMGAAIATIVAADEPVDGIVWGAPFFEITYRPFALMPIEWWAYSAGYLVRYVQRTDQMLEVYSAEARGKILAYQWIPMRCTRMLIELGARAGDAETLGRFKGKLLWIHPAEDGAASHRAAKKAFDRISASEKKAIVLTHSNHHIYWDGDCELVCRAVEDFVQDQGFAAGDDRPSSTINP